MLENIKVLCHSSIRFEDKENGIIYFDPYEIDKNYNDADYIFITHSHYDHFSPEDISKVKKDTTKIIVPNEMNNDEEIRITIEDLGFAKDDIFYVVPDNYYVEDNLNFETVPAYNVNKNFHPKEKEWVGYIIHLNDISYYIAGDTDITKENKKVKCDVAFVPIGGTAGDTDITEENKKVKCDVAFVPIGGTYTMTAKEAAKLVNEINPKIAVPIHYGLIVGKKEDANIFKENLNSGIKCEIMIK